MKPTSLLAIALLATHPAVFAEDATTGIQGMLGFNNGDQLHGHFMGFTPDSRVVWRRDDLQDSPAFELANVRRIILRGGRPEEGLASDAHASLTNGDRIPGRILSLDDERLVLETAFAGNLSIPRDRLGLMSPNPHGGRIFYHGPYAADEWEFVTQSAKVIEDEDEQDEEETAAEDDQDEAPDGWTHSGAAWYWPGSGDLKALVRKDTLPDSAVMRFQVSWKSRVSLAVAFHADFKQPGPKAGGEGDRGDAARRIHPSDSSLYTSLFGNCYVLQLNPTHALMYRSTIDDEGNASVDRMQSGFNSVRLGDVGSATVEIRASRTSGDISLFINDQFVAQWSEIGHLIEDATADGYAGAGSGFGFLMQSNSSPARISDILIANWNGMPDAARSMQVEDHDIVLLTNGTDRFSGKVTRIADGQLSLDGRYGGLNFPIEEVAEVRFARNSLSQIKEETADEITIRLHPVGLVSGVPRAGDARGIRMDHSICGPMEIDLSSAVMFEASRGETFLDAWDPEF